jgi:hypothetical protein
MALTVRAVRWAVDALSCDDTTVSALARHLGVDWHTCWDAIEVENDKLIWPHCAGLIWPHPGVGY